MCGGGYPRTLDAGRVWAPPGLQARLEWPRPRECAGCTYPYVYPARPVYEPFLISPINLPQYSYLSEHVKKCLCLLI